MGARSRARADETRMIFGKWSSQSCTVLHHRPTSDELRV